MVTAQLDHLKLIKMGRSSDSREHLEMGDHSDAVRDGSARAQLGEWKSSLDDLNRALEIVPDYSFAVSCRTVTPYEFGIYRGFIVSVR